MSECLDRYIEEYVPRLKNAKREIDRARFIQKWPLAHRIMATISAKDIADFRREREAEGVSGNTMGVVTAVEKRYRLGLCQVVTVTVHFRQRSFRAVG